MAMQRRKKPQDNNDQDDRATSRGTNRGRGIYFSDDEFRDLIEEVAMQNYEQRRPVSNSEVVRTAVMEYIQRQRARREREQGKKGNE